VAASVVLRRPKSSLSPFPRSDFSACRWSTIASVFTALVRLLLVSSLASACAPVLKIRRLAAPQAALGTARTVLVHVTPASTDAIPDQPEKLSELVRRQVSERLTASGYAVCPQAPCGDGVLEVAIEQASFGSAREMPHLPSFAMMDAAVKAVRGGSSATVTDAAPDEQATAQLLMRFTLVQPDGTVGFRRSIDQSVSRPGKVGPVLKEAVDGAVKWFGDLLVRQAPVAMVPLEGGGELNHGVELLHKADWAGAVAWFTELTRTQPELDGAWYDLGFALEAQGAWKPALDAYREAAKRAKKPHYEKAVSTAEAVLFVPRSS